MGKAHRRITIPLAALSLLAAACTGNDADSAATTVSPTTSTETPATTVPLDTTAPATTAEPAPGQFGTGRLLVVGDDGNVVTMLSDGTDLNNLTADAGPSISYFQPAWSPDATAVAVSRFNGAGFALVRIDTDSGDTAEVATEANAFYFYWSPDGSKLGYLATGGQGMGLNLASFEDDSLNGPIGLGAPFYFDWSPSGERLATLVGERNFDVRDSLPDASASTIAEPGQFLNPIWTDNGLFYVSADAGTEQIVVGEPGGASRPLAIAPAPLVMTASSGGELIAVQATGLVEGVEASFQTLPTLPLNRLVVIDVATGELTQVTDTAAAAYFWDPAGEKLLILDSNNAQRRLRWSVWDGAEVRELVEFLPSRVWADTYLPFFGQYALSTTMWSPDGRAIAFPGLIGDRGGIWVQSIDGGDPQYVADGNWVMWSPR